MKAFKIYHYYPLGDNYERQQQDLLKFLKDGWKIIASGGQEVVMVYILEREAK